MTVAAIIQARMGSSRLPGKVLEPLGAKPVLAWVVDAARAIPGVGEVIVATSDGAADDPVATWAETAGVRCVRGPLDDVLARFRMAVDASGAEAAFRLTADCPLLDPEVCAQVLQLWRVTGCDYATSADNGTWPDGLDCELITADALRVADAEAKRGPEREHVTPFVLARRDRFQVRSLVCPVPGLGGHRWTLDGPEDLTFLRALVDALPKHDGPPGMGLILETLRATPALANHQPQRPRNESYQGLAPTDGQRNGPFDRSQALLERTLKTIPVGSQTFSKSHLQYPSGASPLYVTHGRGGRVWDVDGNEYVDMVCGLLSVSIGYSEPVVDEAIRDQLSRGISFTLPTRLEAELAERLVDLIPAAEQVRFGKNGTDATSAAIRMARAYTGRDGVIACGYHGWQDWYIGATARSKGVPGSVRGLTQTIGYNDLAALEAAFAARPDGVAAVIMEPITFDEPAPGYLQAVKDMAHRNGALLVFDEIVSGFRYARGGAQVSLGVTPDLASFGKGMGNGMPISAVVGRKDVMREMEDIFFSGTFGGETLSLAAGLAVLGLMDREPVLDTILANGATIKADVAAAIERHDLGQVLAIKGRPAWTTVTVADHPTARKEAIRTLMLREMLAGGVLTLGTHNVCYRHGPADLALLRAAYDRAFAVVADALAQGDTEQRLGGKVIEPIFQVRKVS